MNDPVQQMMKKTQRYWYVDGLAEIGAGALILLLGLLYLVVGWLPWQGVKAILLGLGMPVLLLGGMVGVRAWVNRAKQRLTYPRTGYVEYRRPKTARRWLVLLLSGVVSATTIALLINFMPLLGERFVMALTGLLVFAGMSYLAYQVNLWRFLLVGAAALAGGLLASLLNIPDPFNSALFFGVFGAAWLVSGGLTLRAYLASSTPAEEDADEEG
ncbi:hypothetical protein ADN00_01825 [Ornatilinea apprima]|uniref:Uncharacterized protein n=1 Tax=Ornatilinea apprima TaxID=1134406 RepID=A0A0P6XJF6_9CHLR|nr:hypothetical protein [Ornatilinea apprima]KPL80126.1 hypothetical protein ADN00_01825 [Ornatilinea apprima]